MVRCTIDVKIKLLFVGSQAYLICETISLKKRDFERFNRMSVGTVLVSVAV